MSELDGVTWPVGPIETRRLLLREPEARDRVALLDLLSDPEVGVYIGGTRSRDDLDAAMPVEPRRRTGLFVVEHDRSLIGLVTFDRREVDRPGHIRPDTAEAELGYLFAPNCWGRGYAAEACAAALDWFDGASPGEPVVLCTQTANTRSVRLATRLGFEEVGRFEEFGAEQWFGVRNAPAPG